MSRFGGFGRTKLGVLSILRCDVLAFETESDGVINGDKGVFGPILINYRLKLLHCA